MPEGMGYSKDFAHDIARLIQLGQAGDAEAQQAIVQLDSAVEGGNERVAAFMDDAASRIKEQRHFPMEGKQDSTAIVQSLGELLGTKDDSQPTEREQRLLMIIAKQAAQLKAAGIEDVSEGPDAELRAGEASTQDSSLS